MKERYQTESYKSFVTEQQKRANISRDFSKISINKKILEDITFSNQTEKQKINSKFNTKANVLNAISRRKIEELRDISKYYFETSGLYSRLCKFLAYLYRYDWYIAPYISDFSKVKDSNKLTKEFFEVLEYFENSNIAKSCQDIALTVVTEGCYYGYISDRKDGLTLQKLPNEYCRSRFYKEGIPVVEFNMKYFKDNFGSEDNIKQILKAYPKDFQLGYILYKNGKLKPTFRGDVEGWYLLDTERAIKFNLTGDVTAGEDIPLLVNAVPSIIDLDEAQEIDRKKTLQNLMKIIIQKFPLDKNGELILDEEEIADFHQNAIQMLRKVIGVDVLTTFADVDVADLSDTKGAVSNDNLSRVERSVYNEFGVSRNLFNSDSNLALTNSILDDEATIRNFVLQLEAFFNRVAKNLKIGNAKKCKYKFKMLETTIYNYKELSKIYKEQTQIGYSKMLPQIALGHSQGEIISTAIFENQILNLAELMVPPRMSSTMGNGQQIQDKNDKKSNDKNQKNIEGNKTAGRPQKEDSEKSDKTIANKESM